MNDNKKLALTLLIGLVLGVAIVLSIQHINKKDDLETPNTPVVDKGTKKENVNFTISIDTEASTQEINEVQEKIKSMDIEISSMTFKDKEQVRKEKIAQSTSDSEKKRLESYTPETNPLDHILLLSVKNVEDKDSLKQTLMILVNVTEVTY